jgi:hypothetical protein
VSVPPDKLHRRQAFDPFLVWTGPWNGTTLYQIGNVASTGGIVYICILDHNNHVPPNVTYWVAT